MDIYVKPKKKAELTGLGPVRVSDIADVLADGALQKRAEAVVLLKPQLDGAYLVSVLDVVKSISAALPGHSVVNLGEMDTIVSVKAKAPKQPSVLKWVKIAVVAAILFVGASTAIMAFHTDSQMGTVFQNYHKILFGTESEKPYIITIPYSIGLALGIIVFFNHIAGKKLTKEPTPIEVEMVTYDKDVEEAVLTKLEEKDEAQ